VRNVAEVMDYLKNELAGCLTTASLYELQKAQQILWIEAMNNTEVPEAVLATYKSMQAEMALRGL